MQYRIEHLGLGGILDQAIALTKNHFGLLFGIMLCLFIPFQLIGGFLQLAMLRGFTAAPDSVDPSLLVSYLPMVFVLGLVNLVIVFPVTNAAVMHAVAKLYLGQKTSVGESIRRGFRVLLPLIATTILMYLAILGGLILLIIPGILFALWFGLSQHVVVIEGTSGAAALSRSRQLVRPYLGTLLMLGILLFLITAMLQGATGLIPQPHIAMVVTSLVVGVTTVFGTAAWVVFYFSCRCGVENFDLQYLADSIGEPAPVEEEEEHPTYGV